MTKQLVLTFAKDVSEDQLHDLEQCPELHRFLTEHMGLQLVSVEAHQASVDRVWPSCWLRPLLKN